MIGHQIIQTSCRRGISGGGSGFQVFSCDEGLAELGFLNGTEYQRLFVYDTPVEVGVPSFGYASVDGVGSVFSLNTRLAHDFGGTGTRSGNLLNHSIVASGPIAFYPAELFGSPLLRTEMTEAEVNNDNLPDYLPQLELVQAETISIETVARWIDEGDRVEAVERLLGAYISARSEGQMLIIFDSPTNVVRWVAALEYCLPLKVAREICFVNYSENAASVKANIAGATKELFSKNTPSYMQASICLFDPAAPAKHALPEGPFIDFVDISYSLNPTALIQFSIFMNEGIEFPEELTLEALNNAYAVYSLTKDRVDDWTPVVIRNGLRYALERGTNELNNRIEDIIKDNHDSLSNMDSDSYLETLEYLIRRWPMLDTAGKNFVEGVAVGNVMGILQQEDTDESVFQDYFEAITKACAIAGLNIFEMLMGDESQSRLFSIAQKLSQPKLRLLALALTDFVLTSNLPLERLTAQTPLGTLYTRLLECAFAQGIAAGTGLAQSIIAASSTKLPYLENLVMTIDWSIREAYRCKGATGSPEEQSSIDAIWDTCITSVAENHASEINSATKWLLWAADYDSTRYRSLIDLYDRLTPNCLSTKEALNLFSSFCPERALANDAFMTEAYPQLASRFALMLRRFNDEDAATTARSLLDSSLNSHQRLDFIPALMEYVSEGFGIKKTAPADMRLVDKAVDYEYRTGGLALAGRAALLDAVRLLEDAPRTNNPAQAIDQLGELSTSLDLSILDDKAYREYAKRIGPAITRTARSGGDVDRIVVAYGLSGDRLAFAITEAFEPAMKNLTRNDDPTALIALTSYAAITADRWVDSVCVKSIGGIKAEDDLYYIDDMTRQALRGFGSATVKHWSRIFDQAYDRHSRGLLGRFRR